ncbi:buddy of Hmr 1 [Musca autumnalis]|uniref:buddy of Hmr 1 n=1 Tax=Musca autumnalis TaxID=221902 RepID=UPI003CE6C3EF
MNQNKGSKELIKVNYRELPETICVETRFITRAGAQQKKDQHLFYMNVNRGKVELSKYEAPKSNNVMSSMVSSQYKNLPTNKPPMVTVSVRNKAPVATSVVPPNPTPQLPPVFTNPPPPQVLTVQPPLNLGISAPYNISMLPDPSNIMSTVSTPQSTVTIPLPNPVLPNMHFNTSPVFMKPPVQLKNAECMTEPKARTINRSQQTDETPAKIDLAIQCNMDDANFFEEITEDSNNNKPVELSLEEEKEEFLKYVKANSVEYKNHYWECQICGEVCKKAKYFYGHMAIHRGPKLLCFICGQYLDHEALLNKHNCKNSKRINRALLRCPVSSCPVVAISRLELYDHINEHKKYRVHHCSACHKAFCTAQEFLRHLLLRAKCYTEAKRNRNRLYGLKLKSERLCRVRVSTLHTLSKRTAMIKRPLTPRTKNKRHLCVICFRVYRSKFIFNRHVKRCSKSFKKHSKGKMKKTNNGCNGDVSVVNSKK